MADIQPSSGDLNWRLSAHPITLVTFLAFRISSLLVYLLGMIFTTNFVMIFIITIILLAMDFYYLKNIAGRRLVGLRWWNEVNTNTGESHWVFESAPQANEPGGKIVNATDKRFFWLALYAQPGLWVALAIVAFVKLAFVWLTLVVIALVLTITNTLAFSRCDKFSQASGLVERGLFTGSLARNVGGAMFSRLINRGSGPTFLFGLQAYLSAAPRALLPLDNNIAPPGSLQQIAPTRDTFLHCRPAPTQKRAFDMASRFDFTWRENEPGAFAAQTLPVNITDFEKILEHHKAAEDGLNKSLALLEDIPGTELAVQQIRLEVEKVGHSVESVGTLVKQVWDLVPPLMWPTDGAAADKVFRTPELLEEVLNYLPTRTKLDCMAVQRRWYDAVNDSVRLKRSLGLEPSTNPFYHSAFKDSYIGGEGRLDCSLPNDWKFYEEDYPNPEGEFPYWGDQERRWWTEYDASKVLLCGHFSVSNATMGTFGSRVHDMRIASPAIRNLDVSFACCSAWGGCSAHHSPEVLHAPTPEGFTAGSLHDTVTEYFEKHRITCELNHHHHSSVPIHVATTIYLHEDDPIYIERQNIKAKRLEWCAEQMRAWEECSEHERVEQDQMWGRNMRDEEDGSEDGWGLPAPEVDLTSDHDPSNDENDVPDDQISVAESHDYHATGWRVHADHQCKREQG
ncbi:hypothetical protein CBER1_02208 [Cercospora berteroae]|uniref:Golgi apparatus membrane protein TVP23 n=1 Tax=Cercospora berteroae TaxID=357750 RepID=A0A2S6BQC6_9PEZI|nr:hypothetical protein CBER1_02208 [Cercospora berteroae]